MGYKIEGIFNEEELGIRVRAILGVPEEILTDEIISSPTFILKSEKFIDNKLKDHEDEEIDKNLVNIAFLYYMCYLICSGMYARLPRQMENVSTKTILQNIDWTALALEMLDKANETLEDLLEEEDTNLGGTFAVLSDESTYPNTLI